MEVHNTEGKMNFKEEGFYARQVDRLSTILINIMFHDILVKSDPNEM